MRFRVAAVLVLAFGLLGCLMPVDGLIRIPDPDPSPNTPEYLVPGWKCPASEDMHAIAAIVNPPCSWVPGAMFVQSCRKEVSERRLLAFGCVRVPKVAIWYIMTPPFDADRHLNPNVPIQNWNVWAPYTTEAECQAALVALKPSHDVVQERLAVTQPLQANRQDEIDATTRFAQCASSDVARPDL